MIQTLARFIHEAGNRWQVDFLTVHDEILRLAIAAGYNETKLRIATGFERELAIGME
jgi:Uri superfamily endonuclease